MARMPRVVIPGCPHHIIQRGNRRQQVFFSDDDKAFYLRLLRRQTAKHGISIWAFCLMSNHVHLIGVPSSEKGLARGMGEAHRLYTNIINTRENWKGHLWQGRFISYPLEEKHLYAAVRYIERNPVRARIVQRAEDYPWSSARAHVKGTHHPLLSPCPLQKLVGDWSTYLGQEDTQEDAKKFAEHELSGRPMGSDTFIKNLEVLTGRTLLPRKRGRKKRKLV